MVDQKDVDAPKPDGHYVSPYNCRQKVLELTRSFYRLISHRATVSWSSLPLLVRR